MHRASHDLLTEVALQRCQSIQTKEKRILDSALLGNPENQATPLTYPLVTVMHLTRTSRPSLCLQNGFHLSPRSEDVQKNY